MPHSGTSPGGISPLGVSPGGVPPARAGFTFIELMVVLAIMAMMLGLAMPYLGRSLGRSADQSAAAQLRVALRGAGAEAITEGHAVVFRADPRGGYWIGSHYAALAGASAARLRIMIEGTGQIAFYPWGGASGGRVWIDGPQGRSGTAIDTVTGRAAPLP